MMIHNRNKRSVDLLAKTFIAQRYKVLAESNKNKNIQ